MPAEDKLFQLQIMTPEKVLCNEKVSMVSVPGKEGRLVIMCNHEPMIISLKPGYITFKNTTDISITINLISMGTVDISSSGCIILASKVVIN